MKKFFVKLGKGICMIIILPITLLMGLIFLLYLLFEIIRYFMSPYYKNTRNKYSPMSMQSDVVRLYNYNAKRNSNESRLVYFCNDAYEYFLKYDYVLKCDLTLDELVLLCGYSCDCFKQIDGEWYFVEEDGEGNKSAVSMAETLQDCRKKLKDKHRELDVKFLLNYEDITDADRFELAKTCQYFYCITSYDDLVPHYVY